MKNTQVLNTILIIAGAGMLLYAIAVENAPVYFKIIGLIVIMFGLFRATNFWVDTKDDHKKENEEEWNF